MYLCLHFFVVLSNRPILYEDLFTISVILTSGTNGKFCISNVLQKINYAVCNFPYNIITRLMIRLLRKFYGALNIKIFFVNLLLQ